MLADTGLKNSELRTGLSNIGILLIVVSIVVGTALLAYYVPSLTGGLSTSRSSTTHVNPTRATTNVPNSDLGILFTLSVNATLLQPGQGINITLAVENTRNEVNIISPSSNYWSQPMLKNASGLPFLCSPRWVSFLIYEGHYTPINITTGKPLLLLPSGYVIECPAFNANKIAFESHSGIAQVSGIFVGETNPANMTIGISSTIEGYYTTQRASPGANLDDFPPQPFPQGDYTILAGDQWGDLGLLYFQVA